MDINVKSVHGIIRQEASKVYENFKVNVYGVSHRVRIEIQITTINKVHTQVAFNIRTLLEHIKLEL